MLKALWGTFGTWLSAFNGPCLWACVAAAGVAGWGAATFTYKIQDARVARAEARLIDFRADIAQTRTDVLEQGRQLQERSSAETREALQRAVNVLSGEIALTRDRDALAELNLRMEKLHEDARFACRQLPLPDWYIDGLRIEAGQVGPGPGDSH